MSEKIFILCQDDLGNYEIRYDDKVFHFLGEVAPILNEQQVTIEQQENEIEKLKVEKQMLEKVISNNLSDFKNGGWHRIRDLR